MDALRRWALRCVPKNLSDRLMLAVSLVLCTALGLLGLAMAQAQGQAALQTLQGEAAGLARNLALASENAVLSHDIDGLERLLLRAVEFPSVLQIDITDVQGVSLSRAVRPPGGAPRTVYVAPNTRLAPPGQAAPQIDSDQLGSHLGAWHPIAVDSPLGWVRVDQSTESVRLLQRQTQRSTLLAVLLTALACVLVLNRVLHQPLRTLHDAQHFAQGLQQVGGQQLAWSGGPAETQALVASLNRTSTDLWVMRQAMDASLAARRQDAEALADSNEQLRTVSALSPDAWVCFDAQDRVRHTNAAFHRITGIDRADVADLTACGLEERLRALCNAAGAFPGLDAYFPPAGSADASTARVPQRLTLDRPQPTVLELVGVLSDAPTVSRLLYLRDITHDSEVDRMKSEFLSTAAHELRTPMTSIHACVELMLARDFDAARRRQMLGVMQRQSNALRNVVDELLDLARIEARGSVDFEFANVDLAGLVQQAALDFAPPAARARPEIEGLAGALTVHADRLKTVQVLRNLLSNAYKYSAPGTAVRLRLLPAEAGPAGLRAGFEVQDRGVGMSASELARVGERFYRADASGHAPGTGLGISIVQEILTLMGGSLVLRSQAGLGTTATVWLPTAPAEVEAKAEGPVRRPESAAVPA
jgi:signal transduction histidine kinase